MTQQNLTRRELAGALACVPAAAVVAAGVVSSQGVSNMNALTKIETAGVRQFDDGPLLALFERYEVACAATDRAMRGRWREQANSERWCRVLILRRERLRAEILATPAFGPAGIAVKLATLPTLILMDGCGNEQLDRLHDPVRAALADALRLAGLKLSQTGEHVHERRPCDPVLPRVLQAA